MCRDVSATLWRFAVLFNLFMYAWNRGISNSNIQLTISVNCIVVDPLRHVRHRTSKLSSFIHGDLKCPRTTTISKIQVFIAINIVFYQKETAMFKWSLTLWETLFVMRWCTLVNTYVTTIIYYRDEANYKVIKSKLKLDPVFILYNHTKYHWGQALQLIYLVT